MQLLFSILSLTFASEIPLPTEGELVDCAYPDTSPALGEIKTINNENIYVDFPDCNYSMVGKSYQIVFKKELREFCADQECNETYKEERIVGKIVKEITNDEKNSTTSPSEPIPEPSYFDASMNNWFSFSSLGNCPNIKKMKIKIDNSKNQWSVIQVVSEYTIKPPFEEKCDTESWMFEYPTTANGTKAENDAICKKEGMISQALIGNTKVNGTFLLEKGVKIYGFENITESHRVYLINDKGEKIHKEFQIGCGD